MRHTVTLLTLIILGAAPALAARFVVAPVPDDAPPVVRRLQTALGVGSPPAGWSRAIPRPMRNPRTLARAVAADTVLWVELTPAGPVLCLFHRANGRVVRLPVGVSVQQAQTAEAIEAARLQLPFLFQLPPSAGQPLKPPPLPPIPPPLSPAQRRALHDPPPPARPHRPPPIVPRTPARLSAAAPTPDRLRVTTTGQPAAPRQRSPMRYPSLGLGAVGGLNLGDAGDAELGYAIHIRLPVGAQGHAVRAEGAAMTGQHGTADERPVSLTTAQLNLSWSQPLWGGATTGSVVFGGGYEGLFAQGADVRVQDTHRAIAVLGGTITGCLEGPLSWTVRADLRGSPWAPTAYDDSGRMGGHGHLTGQLTILIDWALLPEVSD